jgi:23S rRNA pseudouridine2605 synthase
MKGPENKNKPESEGVRLNKYIANSGVCSRRKADELIAAGKVQINGDTVKEMGIKVQDKDKVSVSGKPIKPVRSVYVLLNKPKGYITTTDDPKERKIVMDLVANATKERIYPVGRLDRQTTGLLVLTNDGDMAQRLAHPSFKISKLYSVELNKDFSEKDFEKVEKGVELEDGMVKVDDLAYVEGKSRNNVGIKIHSGKNRVIRRLFEHLGYTVEKLDRVSYAGLTKKDLPRSKWRYLTPFEVRRFKSLRSLERD